MGIWSKFLISSLYKTRQYTVNILDFKEITNDVNNKAPDSDEIPSELLNNGSRGSS